MFSNEALAAKALIQGTLNVVFREDQLLVNLPICFEEFLKLFLSKTLHHLFASCSPSILQAQPALFDCIVVAEWNGSKNRPKEAINLPIFVKGKFYEKDSIADIIERQHLVQVCSLSM